MLDRIMAEGLGARLKDTVGLVKQTFAVFGRDADLVKPVVGMVVYETIAWLALLGGMTLIVFGVQGTGPIGIGVLALLVGLAMRPVAFFYLAGQRGKLSALAYDVVRGDDATIPKAKKRVSHVRGSLFTVGLVDWLVSVAKNRAGNQGGIVGAIMSILVAALAEVWDLVSNFLLPAVVIEQKGAMSVVKELRELKRNVPAAIVGVLGFDAFGTLVRWAVSGVLLLLIGIGIVAPILLFGFGPLTLAITLVVVLLIALVSAFISQAVIGAKSVYFTLFYVALTRPHEIAPSISKDITALLPAEVRASAEKAAGAAPMAQARTPQADPAQRSAQQAQNAQLGPAAPGPDPAGGSAPSELVRAVRMMRERHGTDEQIRTFLASKGFTDEQIEAALREAR